MALEVEFSGITKFELTKVSSTIHIFSGRIIHPYPFCIRRNPFQFITSACSWYYSRFFPFKLMGAIPRWIITTTAVSTNPWLIGNNAIAERREYPAPPVGKTACFYGHTFRVFWQDEAFSFCRNRLRVVSVDPYLINSSAVADSYVNNYAFHSVIFKTKKTNISSLYDVRILRRNQMELNFIYTANSKMVILRKP